MGDSYMYAPSFTEHPNLMSYKEAHADGRVVAGPLSMV